MGKGKRRKTVVSRKTVASNVELLLHWIPGACPGPRSGVRRNDDAYRHAGLDKPAPYLIRGHPDVEEQ